MDSIIVEMIELTTHQKLDSVLEVISSNRPTSNPDGVISKVVKEKFPTWALEQTFYSQVGDVLRQLVHDGFAGQESKKNEHSINAVNYYNITFAGRIFLASGGYVK